MRPRSRLTLAALGAAVAAVATAAAGYAVGPPGNPRPAPEWDYDPPATTAVEKGRQLFVEGCSECHGIDARGIEDVAPSLRGVGAAAAHFYLTTGRMPLQVSPGEQPKRSHVAYPPDQIDALIAYVGSFGGPPVPEVDLARGDLAAGFRLYTDNCAGCHQVQGEGGVMPSAMPPELNESTPEQIAEAIRIGPYVMPSFGPSTLSDEEVRDIVTYVVGEAQQEVDPGGWGIGHIGPIPEGMVTFFIGLAVLLLVIRIIGERTTR